AADKWLTSGRRPDLLLRGAALGEMERWLAGRPANAPAPSQSHLDFVAASQLAAKRRSRYWISGITTVAVVATGLAVTAEINRREAVIARNTSEHLLEGG